MWENAVSRERTPKNPHRIRYSRGENKMGLYYILADNADDAILEFVMRTGRERSSVIQVEVRVGKHWSKVL